MKKIQIPITITFAFIFIALFIITITHPDIGYLIGGGYDYLITLVISLLIAAWGFILMYRCQFLKQRYYLIVLVSILFIWILMRFIKWLPNVYYINIYLDYAYYIPMAIVVMLFFIMTLETFYSKIKRRWIIYIIFSTIFLFFIVLALTNELHHLVYAPYKMGETENENIINISTTYRLFHYISLAFVALTSITTFVLFSIGVRKQLSIGQILLLSSSFLLLFAYVVLYTLGVFSHIKVLNDFAASISVLLMMLMEILIDIGLIQNNGRYVKNFTQSMMDIRIKDEEGNILYKTATDNNSIYIKEEQFSFGKYHIQIKEDLSEIKKLEEEIAKENQNIIDKNKKLQTLIQIRKQEQPLSYRLSLIHEIEENIHNSKLEVLKISGDLPDKMDDNAKRQLGYIELLLGYMKQKCMLLLNAKEETNISIDNLKLLTNVISRDIQNAGFDDVGVNILKQIDTDISYISLINDFIYEIAKGYAFKKASMLIVIDQEKRNCSISVFPKQKKKENINFNIIDKYQLSIKENEDGFIYLLEGKNA